MTSELANASKRAIGRRSPGRAFTLVELLVVIGIIVVLLSVLLPTIARARDKARAVKCASDMHQIFIACLMYYNTLNRLPIPGESGHNGFEPGSCCAYGPGGLDFDRGSLWDFLGSSDVDRAAIFLCPADGGYYIPPAEIGHTVVSPIYSHLRNYSYAFNCEMRGPLDPFTHETMFEDPPGIRMTDISRPDRKILIIEIEQIDRLDFDYMATNGPGATSSQQNTFTHRHFGKGNQCFADGHVELVTPIASSLPWQPGSDAYEYLDLFHNPDR